jgi:hypothetical protein
MNLFLVYGIRGRYLSTEASLRQIRERITDIRQKRIPGFPLLGEFIERRVADSIRDITYMSQRYDYLRERMHDAYNRVRTQLNSIQTTQMVEFLKTSAEFSGEVTTILKATQKLQETMGKWTEQHLSIAEDTKRINQNVLQLTQLYVKIADDTKKIDDRMLESVSRQAKLGVLADVFALVAGTYYGYSLLNDVADDVKSLWWGWRFGIAFVIGLLLALLVTMWRRYVGTSDRGGANSQAGTTVTSLSTSDRDIPGENNG